MSNVCTVCLTDLVTKPRLNQHKHRKNPCKPAVIQPIVVDTNSSFRERSERLNKEITLHDRQKQGIFFTPKKARDLLFDKIAQYNFTPTRILEPSFGSGEFLEDALNRYPAAAVCGVELNTKLFKSFTSERATLICGDFLQYSNTEKFDFIIGNPPYFVFDKDAKKDYKSNKGSGCDVDAILSKSCVGRANIYIAFLYKCLTEHLTVGGFLGFVLPTSLFNCSYYEPMRKYIADKCTICFVKKLDVEYYETSQDTMLIILQNKRSHGNESFYRFKYQDRIYISPFYKELRKAVLGTQTLDTLGFLVKTGDVVWNVVGPYLRDTKETGASLLIYTNNIVDGKLVINNLNSSKKCCAEGCTRKDAGFGIGSEDEKKEVRAKTKERWCVDHKKAEMIDFRKKQYIAGYRSQPLKAPAILVSRGFGNASAEYSFIYALVPDGEFYAENHVNVILPQNAEAVKRIPMIMNSLGDSRTSDFIKYFNANGAMSKSELEQVLPIYT